MFRSIGLIVVMMLTFCCSFTESEADAQTSHQGTKGRTIGGTVPIAPMLPERAARPMFGPRGVTAFVESISSQQADAGIEVVLGRPRMLTLKHPLGSKNGPTKILLGDPTIADFQVVSPKQLQLVGRRPGVTDLTFLTSSGVLFTFRISVVYDLDTLKVQLQGVFPDATVNAYQIREHVIFHGEARGPVQIEQLQQTLDAYRQSLDAQLQRGVAK